MIAAGGKWRMKSSGVRRPWLRPCSMACARKRCRPSESFDSNAPGSLLVLSPFFGASVCVVAIVCSSRYPIVGGAPRARYNEFALAPLDRVEPLAARRKVRRQVGTGLIGLAGALPAPVLAMGI